MRPRLYPVSTTSGSDSSLNTIKLVTPGTEKF